MKQELKLKGVQATKQDLLVLKELLERIGAQVSISDVEDYQNPSTVEIVYDDKEVARILGRDAGRKRIKSEIGYTIGDVKVKLEKEGIDELLLDLNMSRATLYRRLSEYQRLGSGDNETF